MQIIKRTVRTLLLAAALVASQANAAELADTDSEAARLIIEGQLTAFSQNDNEAAYAYAAPIIKQQFPSVEMFMAMVMHGFQPVWKPRNFSFGQSAQINSSEIMQQVFLTGPDGKPYEALYTLTKQKNGEFKISAVRVIEATAT